MEQRTRIPKNFEVSSKIIELASIRKWPDPHTECEQFVDYHLAHGTLMLDWEAAFRTWMRNAVRYRNERAERSYTKDPRPVRSAADRQPVHFSKPAEPRGGRLNDDQLAEGRATLTDMVKKLSGKLSI